MTEHEAIMDLQEYIGSGEYNGSESPIYLNTAILSIKALEKQIAKKPVEQYEEDEPSYLCPICEHWVYFNESYCDECGQKLDWSEV